MAVTPVTVGDHLVARMRAAGISVVCGLPTSRLDSLLVRLSRDAGFQIVLARHEGGAGYLADGFARASGKSAAVFVAGPGATNVISAVANASVNQVPMLILTGEVAVGEFGLHSQQDTSDDGLGLGATFRRFCRCSVSIESIANARSKIDSAFRALASIPRGPVHIALPRDLVDERLPAHQLGTAAAGLGGLRTLAPCGPDVADEVIGRLDRSRAPMLVLGNGCRLDGIGEQIVAFCEKAGLPFATTPNGRGIVAETHPLSLGVLGIFGDGRADEYLFDTPCDLVTGSSGHLGEALVRTLRARGADVVSLDSRPSRYTNIVGCVSDRALLRDVMAGVEVVFHAAAHHKPQLAFLPRQAFLDTNIIGTQTVLDAAVAANVRAFVMTSSTTVFGDALTPPADQPAAWIDESVTPIPKNIYGVTKASSEDLCQLAHRNDGLACVVLRVARFFVEGDDMPDLYDGRSQDNIKANEYACRRVALEDAVDAHLNAAQRAPQLGFGRYLVSATTPFTRDDLTQLRTDAASVFARRVPLAAAVWTQRGWRFPDRLDRVYVNSRARRDLNWRPRFDLNAVAARLARGQSVHTPLSQLVGSKAYAHSSYHRGVFAPARP